MQTDSWGPSEWESMHFKTFGSPEVFDAETKNLYVTFFKTNVRIIPCSMCQTAFSNMMRYFPVELYADSRYGLCFWLFIMHNLVNRKLEKPLEMFCNVVYKYENMRARCGSKNDKQKYAQCLANLEPYTMEQAKDLAKKIKEKYKTLAYEHLESYYNSDNVIDPKYHKCKL